MSATYAHITFVKKISDATILTNKGINITAIESICDYPEYCELGAISPDYPALVIIVPEQEEWTNKMHEGNTGDIVKSGIKYIKSNLMNNKNIKIWLSWLFGYVSHVVADTTIHPIVNKIVGSYNLNQAEHRRCEMHQDRFIFNNEMIKGSIDKAAFFKSGIGTCDINEVTEIWDQMLKQAHLDYYSKVKPDFHFWHTIFKKAIDDFSEKVSEIPFVRIYADEKGLTFPPIKKIKPKYIENLEVPTGNFLNYEQIANNAKTNILNIWKNMSDSIFTDNYDIETLISNWNMMTGLNEKNESVFWVNQNE